MPAGRRVTPVVCAVISAYAPDGSLVAACAAVANQVELVVVVDDCGPGDAGPVLDACARAGVVVIRHATNRGVAAALNSGIEAALDRLPAATHLLTLDQDSLVPPGYVAALLEAETAARAAGVAVGMVGPARAGRVRRAARRPVAGFAPTREPIQSGLLVPVEVWAAVGPLREDLVIDGVDTDLWLRARSAGLTAVAAPATHLVHALGSEHAVGGPAGPRVVHAAPFRYYYIARNRVLLVKVHGRSAPGWAIGAVVRDVRHLVLTGVLVPGRRERWRSTLAGLRDGWKGTTGRRVGRD